MATQAVMYLIPELRTKPIEFELEDLPALGWLQITDVGEENLYFTFDNGTKGFCKICR